MNTLVTLGCSLTKGVGSWGDRTKKETDWLKLHNDIRDPQNVKRFHEFSWPNLVGKELGFDKVINLAQDGASNSGQLKHFMEVDLPIKNTYVIWMLTEPLRFSFYRGGKICDLNPVVENSFTESYLNFIQDSTLDGYKEELFYINCLREICENRGYKLILTYWSRISRYTQTLDTNKSNWLFSNERELFPINPNQISNVCNHPNEKGYEWIASEIINGVKTNHIDFIVNNPKKSIMYESVDYKLSTRTLLL
jgi:hypothetical protein